MSYTRIVTTYEAVKRTVTKAVPCIVCGRKIRRQRTFRQTINPFNKSADGAVKTRAQIWAELGVKGSAWQLEPEIHPACREVDRRGRP